MEETIKLTEEMDKLEEQAKKAPLIPADAFGTLSESESVEALKKSAYYAVFAIKEHTSSNINDSIKSVNIARFESKKDLKKVIDALDEKGFKLIDIIKGRPLSFKITPHVVNDIKIGD